MARNKYGRSSSNGFKTFTCAQTGVEVTRRNSYAINHKGDGYILGKNHKGKGITKAEPCQRVIRKQDADSASHATYNSVVERAMVKSVEKIKSTTFDKPLSTREIAVMRKKLQEKKDEKGT